MYCLTYTNDSDCYSSIFDILFGEVAFIIVLGLITRTYCMDYIPGGFWPRLLCRLILLSDTAVTDTGGRALQYGKYSERLYWREGIYIVWSEVRVGQPCQHL